MTVFSNGESKNGVMIEITDSFCAYASTDGLNGAIVDALQISDDYLATLPKVSFCFVLFN